MDSNTRKSTVASHQWECMDEQQQALNNVTSTRNYTTKTTLYASVADLGG